MSLILVITLKTFFVMTYEAYHNLVFDCIENYPINWRLGQKIFIYVESLFRNKFNKNIQDFIELTDSDCFYNDDKFEKFLEITYELYDSCSYRAAL